MGRLYAAVLAALFLALTGGAATAAGAIAYSAPDEFYGWAAGYDDAGRAEYEAYDACSSAGGKECKAVLACRGGYGSIAYADESAKGVGMVCNLESALQAKIYAQALCVSVSNAMCWTSTTFDRNGDELPTSANLPFDMAYYTQEMLNILDLEPGEIDGQLGPQTRTALRVFEGMIGYPVDGELDEDVFWRLVDFTGGSQSAAIGYANVVEGNKAELGNVSFAVSSAPFPRTSFSEQIARRADIERRKSLATLLIKHNEYCTIPAESAEPIPSDGTGGWHVRCAEGDFTMIMDDWSMTIMQGFADITVSGGTISASPNGGPESGGGNVVTPRISRPGGGTTGRTLGH